MIRLGVNGDIPEIVLLGRRMYNESQFTTWVEWDDNSTAQHVKYLLRDPNSIVFVKEVDGAIAGFFTGHVRPVFFNNNVIQGIEDNWYVSPEQRRSSAGVRLLQKFMQWAKAKGAVSMLLSDRAFIEREKVQKLMGAFGFRLDGISYRREL